jgi:hypothetical protein
MELKQNTFWDKRYFKLLDKEVEMRIRSITLDIQGKIRYEDLGTERLLYRKQETSLLIFVILIFSALGFILIAKYASLSKTIDLVVTLLAGAVFLSMIFLLWIGRRRPLITITGGRKSITVLAFEPGKEEVERFLDELSSRVKKRIVQVRVRPKDTKMSFEYKKDVVEMLKDDGIINEEEAETILDEIKKLKPEGGIGYFSSND